MMVLLSPSHTSLSPLSLSLSSLSLSHLLSPLSLPSLSPSLSPSHTALSPLSLSPLSPLPPPSLSLSLSLTHLHCSLGWVIQEALYNLPGTGDQGRILLEELKEQSMEVCVSPEGQYGISSLIRLGKAESNQQGKLQCDQDPPPTHLPSNIPPFCPLPLLPSLAPPPPSSPLPTSQRHQNLYKWFHIL